MSVRESEFRSYPYITTSLRDVGWDTKSPGRGGQVYTQNEAALQNSELKQAFGKGRPEYTVAVSKKQYWVIEAKIKTQELEKALAEAKQRAEQINNIKGIDCKIVTGFAGSPDTTHYIETHCLVHGKWKPLLINNRQSTGFISPKQAETILAEGIGRLDEYEIDDKLFSKKIGDINKILHNGAIHKRSRAEVLACLLLALANDQSMGLSNDPATLINDINSRAEGELKKYNKQQFFTEIRIKQPTSDDNHIKNKEALTRSIEILRDLNIASTINSGHDVLGQCYEQFLKYANDAKEIGIVLTPRHITNFGAEIVGIQKNDIVFDPTCGTGGFLVAALDKVRRDGGDMESFKKGNLHGVEQDPLIATLAIINMVFRGDGSSNIKEGNCLTTPISEKFHKVLMNPPFALDTEYEWQFVDRAMELMNEDGLLFAILPTTAMNSSKDNRGEITWRKNFLKRHKLIAVIKLAEELFYPQVLKGTYGVVVKAHCPHKIEEDNVLWAILYDGVVRTKTHGNLRNNMGYITRALKNYILADTKPDYILGELDCSTIEVDDQIDLSPENHIGKKRTEGSFDISDVRRSIEDARRLLNHCPSVKKEKNCGIFKAIHFFDSLERGKSGREKNMRGGGVSLDQHIRKKQWYLSNGEQNGLRSNLRCGTNHNFRQRQLLSGSLSQLCFCR